MLLNMCRLLCREYGLPVFLPTFKDKEPINFIRLQGGGCVGRSEVMFGAVLHGTPTAYRTLLCKMIFMNGFRHRALGESKANGNGSKPYFPVTFNPSRRQEGGLLCSTEHGKLCFEAPGTGSVPQNNLPCRWLETPSEVEVL